MSQSAPTQTGGPLPLTQTKPVDEWIENGYYAFMDQHKHSDSDPVRVLLDLKSGIEALPEDRAVFKLTNVLDEFDYVHVLYEYITLCGAWRVPEAIASKGARKYVNPNYPDAHLYSDAIVRCPCGTAMLQPERVNGSEIIDGGSEHADDCKPYHRLRARAELAEKREQIIRTMLLLGVDSRPIAARLGVTSSSFGQLAAEFGINITDLRHEARGLMAETCRQLLPRHGPHVLGSIFGYHPQTINEYVRQYADGDVSIPEFSAQRKRADEKRNWQPNWTDQ